MNRRAFLTLTPALATTALAQRKRRTTVSIRGDAFYINGQPTYKGRQHQGAKIEGLLMNVRAVQATFDDRNPETRSRWNYPDTGKWDPERNTREFIAAMPEWRRNGLLSFTLNLQGGSPEGYSKAQPWHNSAIEADGSLRPDYMGRFERILNRADELGMAPIVGVFYFGQDQRRQGRGGGEDGGAEYGAVASRKGLRECAARNLQREQRQSLRPRYPQTPAGARVDRDGQGHRRGRQALTRGNQLRRRLRATGKRGPGVGFPAGARQRRERPEPHHARWWSRRARFPAIVPCPFCSTRTTTSISTSR